MEQGNQPQTEKVAAPELTITDLINLRSIVEAAVRRGAFNASEISSVGSTFDKLNSFLNSVQAQTSQEKSETTTQ